MRELSEKELLEGFLIEVCPPKAGRGEEMSAKKIEAKMSEALELIRENRFFSGAAAIFEKHSEHLEGFQLDVAAARNKESLVPLFTPIAKAGSAPKEARRALAGAAKDLGSLRGTIGASKNVVYDVMKHLWFGDLVGKKPILGAEGLEDLRIRAMGSAGPLIRAEKERDEIEEAMEAPAQASVRRPGL